MAGLLGKKCSDKGAGIFLGFSLQENCLPSFLMSCQYASAEFCCVCVQKYVYKCFVCVCACAFANFNSTLMINVYIHIYIYIYYIHIYIYTYVYLNI